MKGFLLGVLFTVLVVTGVYFYLNFSSNLTFTMGDAMTTDIVGSGMSADLASIKADLMDIKMMLTTTSTTNTMNATADTMVVNTAGTGTIDTGTTITIN